MTNLEYIINKSGDKKIDCYFCQFIEDCDGSWECPTIKENAAWLLEEHKEPIHFSEDEQAILRNLPKEYKWIIRNKIGDISVYTDKPYRLENEVAWRRERYTNYYSLIAFQHLFQQIELSDTEPVNFREILENELQKEK